MHKSRLAQIVIDCQGPDVEAAAHFWAYALGRPVKPPDDPADWWYRELGSSDGEIRVLVQSVAHASRAHLDIETDDVEAEVQRLERLGARRSQQVRTWWVMEAPTSQRFCVVPRQTEELPFEARFWP
jgi:hypothetical protein